MKLKILIKYKARFKKMPLSILRNQNGVTAVLVAIVAAMLLGFTALAVDVGYMYSTRNELQNMADAAALAGAGELGRIYLALDSAIPEGFDVGVDDPDTEGTYRDRIEAVAENTAAQNKAAGITININEGDIDIGDWIWATSELIISNIKPDAVRVTVVRTSVATFFGKIFSFFGGSADTFQVSAVATAALSSPATVGPGELYVPFGISTNFFDKPPDPPEPCVTSIEFSPTMSSCAAWHNFFDPINANDLEEKLIGLIESYEPPEGPPLYGTLENIDGSAWLDKYFTIINTPEGVPTPATQAITAFDFQNGQIQSMFKTAYYIDWSDDGRGWETPQETEGISSGNLNLPAPIITLFDFFRFRDGDGVPGETIETCDPDVSGGSLDPLANSVWTATVPIYDDGDTCDAPNKTLSIVGYATIQILEVNPDGTIKVCVPCDTTAITGQGGGGDIGNLLAIIPDLVQ